MATPRPVLIKDRRRITLREYIEETCRELRSRVDGLEKRLLAQLEAGDTDAA